MMRVAALPDLPDLTQSATLQALGELFWIGLLIGVGGVVVLGGVVILLHWAQGRPSSSPLVSGYERWLLALPHLLVMGVLLTATFYGGSTLARRYHDWEQAQLHSLANRVAGERMEQMAPQLLYTVLVPYRYLTYVDGQPVQVEEEQPENRYRDPIRSEILVELKQSPALGNWVYQGRVQATYQFRNDLPQSQRFQVLTPLPTGYRLLQDWQVKLEGESVDADPERELAPDQTLSLEISYGIQGGSRWIYDATNRLLAQFRLTIVAQGDPVEFASGIAPTLTTRQGDVTTYTWDFAQNVAVRDPFGVFTLSDPLPNTGILPRLLILSVGILAWWWFLLYLSIPPRLQDLGVSVSLFWATGLGLTYLSRVMPVAGGFLLMGGVLLALLAGLGENRQQSLSWILATLAGVVLPVGSLLIPYTGLGLSVAGIAGAGWLVVRSKTLPRTGIPLL
ncbi:MAG: hypothetical protein NW237_10760 [Cyanobacteriota bacterium]|nr:hypothetical protein [Cyanobacteriota bacterium]